MATAKATAKRKRKVLSIEDKVAIIKKLEVTKACLVAEEYGVGKSTISDIKKSKKEILAFKQKMSDIGMEKTKAKVMKIGDDPKHDAAVYLWFQQKRAEGVPVSGPILCEKAVHFHQKMYGEESNFSGSKGWQWRDMG